MYAKHEPLRLPQEMNPNSQAKKCFSSYLVRIYVRTFNLEFGPEVVPELIREMGSPANPAGGIPGNPGIRESSKEPGF